MHDDVMAWFTNAHLILVNSHVQVGGLQKTMVDYQAVCVVMTLTSKILYLSHIRTKVQWNVFFAYDQSSLTSSRQPLCGAQGPDLDLHLCIVWGYRIDINTRIDVFYCGGNPHRHWKNMQTQKKVYGYAWLRHCGLVCLYSWLLMHRHVVSVSVLVCLCGISLHHRLLV